MRKGDTLHAIAFDYGMDWRDIASWNHIPSPYLIYPDQELRLSAPGSSTGGNSVATSGGARSSQSASPGVSRNSEATTSGLKTPSATTTSTPSKPPSSTTASTSPVVTAPSPKSSTPVRQAPSGKDPSAWLWPTEGKIVSNFKANDPSRNGIEIGGNEGQPIISSAAGEVVYSGNGLIGYGELIIIKHSDRMLSAYAHNRKRLVAEGDKVGAGMKIAEMGRDDRNKALLHFEIRVNGAPGNPLDFLPKR